jgi:hypothetical protein
MRACVRACSFFLVITGEQNKKKITYIPVAEEEEEGNHAPTEIEMGESQPSAGHRQRGLVTSLNLALCARARGGRDRGRIATNSWNG